MTFDLFMALSNFCLSCCGNTRKNVGWHLQICSGCFTQVSELWPMGFLFVYTFPVIELTACILTSNLKVSVEKAADHILNLFFYRKEGLTFHVYYLLD